MRSGDMRWVVWTLLLVRFILPLGLLLHLGVFRLARISARVLCSGRHVCHMSHIRSREQSEIGAKFCHLYRKSGSPSKNITSDFAPEVATYLKSIPKFGVYAILLFHSISNVACVSLGFMSLKWPVFTLHWMLNHYLANNFCHCTNVFCRVAGAGVQVLRLCACCTGCSRG